MAEKRKDSKGRILRAGEGQRPNLTYYYRFPPQQQRKMELHICAYVK